LHAMQALSQLSYSPIRVPGINRFREPLESAAFVGVAAYYFRWFRSASLKMKSPDVFFVRAQKSRS
jgi:hypothetical protein